jgi:hypothetical protein
MEYLVANDPIFGESVVDESGRIYGRPRPDGTVSFGEATGILGQSQYSSRYTGGIWDDERPNFAYDLHITDGRNGPVKNGEYYGMGIAAEHIDIFIGRVSAWKTLMSHEVRAESGDGRSATDEELVAAEKHLIDQGFLLFLALTH